MSSDISKSQNALLDDDFTRLSPSNRGDVQSSAMNGSNYPEHLTILDLVGQGGMGRVQLAYDETIGRSVAVKELLEEFTIKNSANVEVANTFIHEAKITGKLEHPGIVPVYELGKRQDGQPYYVMRYVKGETLERSLKKCVQTETETAFSRRIKLLDIMIDVCDTVAYAHSKGVIHRDLKPANIISGNFGETIVFDWGLAKVVEDSDNTYFYREALTHQRHTLSDSSTSEALGTPGYMAPEQFQGLSGKASDVYSLGVILYRILSGELPYHGSFTDIQEQIESRRASPSVKAINPAAPPELIAICAKAMQMEPENRFADAGELAAQLKAFREGRMVNVYAYSRKELLRRFLAQNKIMVVMASLLIAAIIAGAGFSLFYAKQMKLAMTQAEESLVVVTAFSEQAQVEARAIAKNISKGTRRLFDDLNQAAGQIDMSDSNATQQLLEQLHSEYPKFESFSLRNAAEISRLFSKDVADYSDNIQRPIAKIEDKRVVLLYRAPITQDGKVTAYLEARMYPEKVLPDMIPLNTQSDTHPRHTWIMRNDGLIVFDELPEFIGSNLFINPATNASPSLQAFGRLMLVDDDSIGYYFFTHGDTETHKIAAWDSANFGDAHSWKIIVDYAYMRKKVAP